VKHLAKLLFASALLSLASLAVAVEFEENTHYEVLLPEPPVGKPGDKIEVIEFFMWTCPHCYHFEPFVKNWLANKPDDVEFVRVPAMFGGVANLHAKVYYALQAMGELDRVHAAFFNEIHEKRNRLKDQDAIEAFLRGQGVDIDKFRQAMNSFAVATRTNRAAALMRRYGVRAVPSLVIDSRYRSGRGLDFKGMIELADFLVERVRRERQEESE